MRRISESFKNKYKNPLRSKQPEPGTADLLGSWREGQDESPLALSGPPGFQAVTWVGCFASHRAMAMAMAPSLHREQMESQLEKEARFRQLMAHSSHDSAIDTDSMEWETEVVEFERETVSFLHVFSARSDMKTLDALSQCPQGPHG